MKNHFAECEKGKHKKIMSSAGTKETKLNEGN